MSRIKNELSTDCLKRFAQEQYGLLGQIRLRNPLNKYRSYAEMRHNPLALSLSKGLNERIVVSLWTYSEYS